MWTGSQGSAMRTTACGLLATAGLLTACGGEMVEPSADGFAVEAGAGVQALADSVPTDLGEFVGRADLVAVGTIVGVSEIEGTPVEAADDPAHHEISMMVYEIRVDDVLRGDPEGEMITVPSMVAGVTSVKEIGALIPEGGIRVLVIGRDSSNLVPGVVDASFVARDAGFIVEGDDGRAVLIGGRRLAVEAEIREFADVRSFDDAVAVVATAVGAIER